MIHFKPTYNDSAVITESALLYKLSKWRLYKVKFTTKRALLLVDHPIRERYSNLGRVTNYKFIGRRKYED